MLERWCSVRWMFHLVNHSVDFDMRTVILIISMLVVARQCVCVCVTADTKCRLPSSSLWLYLTFHLWTNVPFLSFKFKQVPFEGGGSKPGGGGGAGKSLNMRMKFACCQCWLDGLISEPDKGLKHCGAKARHAWVKWIQVLNSCTSLEFYF